MRKWWVEDWNQLKRNAEMKDAKTRRLMGYQNALKGDIMQIGQVADKSRKMSAKSVERMMNT